MRTRHLAQPRDHLFAEGVQEGSTYSVEKQYGMSTPGHSVLAKKRDRSGIRRVLAEETCRCRLDGQRKSWLGAR